MKENAKRLESAIAALEYRVPLVGVAIAIVTHDATVAAQTKRVIQMQDGVIIETAKPL